MLFPKDLNGFFIEIFRVSRLKIKVMIPDNIMNINATGKIKKFLNYTTIFFKELLPNPLQKSNISPNRNKVASFFQ